MLPYLIHKLFHLLHGVMSLQRQSQHTDHLLLFLTGRWAWRVFSLEGETPGGNHSCPREEEQRAESGESLPRAPGASSLPEGAGRTRRSPRLMQHATVLTISGRLIPDLSLLKGGITVGDFHPYNQGWNSHLAQPGNPALHPSREPNAERRQRLPGTLPGWERSARPGPTPSLLLFRQRVWEGDFQP